MTKRVTFTLMHNDNTDIPDLGFFGSVSVIPRLTTCQNSVYGFTPKDTVRLIFKVLSFQILSAHFFRYMPHNFLLERTDGITIVISDLIMLVKKLNCLPAMNPQTLKRAVSL